jgi:hypothetical protein
MANDNIIGKVLINEQLVVLPAIIYAVILDLILQNKIPQGCMVFKAIQWLRNRRSLPPNHIRIGPQFFGLSSSF